MGEVVCIRGRHCAASSAAGCGSCGGYRSGRSSDLGTPVARSIDKTNSPGTPFLDLSSQYQTCDCVVPIRSARDFCPPAISQARRKAVLDMPREYQFLGLRQPKTLCGTPNREFGRPLRMKLPVDPAAFGRRVKACREFHGWTQAELADKSGYSQSNITWIESGAPKRPQRAASALAAALGSTPEWLLYEEGPQWVDTPRFIAPARIKEKYSRLSDEQKSVISQRIEGFEREAAAKRTV